MCRLEHTSTERFCICWVRESSAALLAAIQLLRDKFVIPACTQARDLATLGNICPGGFSLFS
jgi:hypothetical protein